MSKTMRAMVLEACGKPLQLKHVQVAVPGENQILVKVKSCGVCRTDLHIVDRELKEPKIPLILGHQIVGIVEKQGKGASRFHLGERIGIPWVGRCCGKCPFCLSGRENLCENGLYTGYQLDGGFAEYCVADQNYCFALPDRYSDVEVAPLLCGGLIGFRAYQMARGVNRLGFYGFGSSAHVLIQIAVNHGKAVYAFTREGDVKAQLLALSLGAVWAGSSAMKPPQLLESALIFAPVGELIPTALESLENGGSVICAGIHMSDIPSFPYRLLYGEKCIRSVANLTREDGVNFFKEALQVDIHPHVKTYPLEEVNRALNDLREGKVTGSIVIVPKLSS